MTKYLKYIYFGAAVFFYIKGAIAYPQTADHGYAAGWAFLCAIVIILFFRRIRLELYFSTKLKKIDKMSGVEFEKYLCAQFKRMGYRVSMTEQSHDYGADLILRKRKKIIVVQAKRYDKNIGIKAVQEIVGAIAYYEADEAMVVTNRYYTKSARKLAEQNDVLLWGRDELTRQFGAK